MILIETPQSIKEKIIWIRKCTDKDIYNVLETKIKNWLRKKVKEILKSVDAKIRNNPEKIEQIVNDLFNILVNGDDGGGGNGGLEKPKLKPKI